MLAPRDSWVKRKHLHFRPLAQEINEEEIRKSLLLNYHLPQNQKIVTLCPLRTHRSHTVCDVTSEQKRCSDISAQCSFLPNFNSAQFVQDLHCPLFRSRGFLSTNLRTVELSDQTGYTCWYRAELCAYDNRVIFARRGSRIIMYRLSQLSS